MKQLFLQFIFLLTALCAHAQMMEPVKFTTSLTAKDDGTGEIVFTAKIEPGWHVYSTDIGDDGPTRATFNVVSMDGVETVGQLSPRGKVTEKYDEMFGATLRFFELRGAFVQKVRFTKPQYSIECYLEYGACNDEMCLPPSTVEFKEKGERSLTPPLSKGKEADTPPAENTNTDKAPEAAASGNEAPEGAASGDSLSAGAASADSLFAGAATTAPPLPDGLGDASLWAPVVSELANYSSPGQGGAASGSLWFIFLSGILGGFLALLTPCVWPIIPMTVSFFLKRNKERGKAIREAVIYGLSIVVIYVLLGLLVTLLFGASALNALSTNALFNIFFALLLVLFAASFMGAFELTLPSSWSNKIDQKSEATTGLLSIFLMAFTLALVSFSCTGPIIGFLLVAVSTQADIIAPTVGMLGFAIALAIPFTFFAIFPSLMKQVPKSGGWMNTVKVTLGFIELAFALKFLSVADMAYGWHLLDREVFLSLWIVIFGLLGIYLLGWLKFPHDELTDYDANAPTLGRTNVPQFFLGLISLAFTVYMVPGLWGAPLHAISAFAPPMNTQDFNLYDGSVEARFTDYDQGMAAALAEGKPVMVDFTGFGCVNCRKMEAAVWTDPQVQQLINDKYVLISLFVDDKTPLPQPIEIVENGQTRTLRTVGDKWSYLERVKIGANTQPFYLLLDPATGKPLNGLRSYDEDVAAYVEFLSTGLRNYK